MSGEQSRLRTPLSLLLLVVFAAGAAALGLWAFAASHDRITVVIPAGTSDQIASRHTLSVVKDPLNAEVGDTIVLRNADDRIHTFDGTAIAPGTTAEIVLSTQRDAVVASSFVNNGELRLIVK